MKSFALTALLSVAYGYKAECNTDEFIALSAAEAHSKLWDKITEDTDTGKWHLPGVFLEGMADTFDAPGDEFPCGLTGCRNKCIHSLGNVAKVKFQHNGTGNFTGIWGASADYGYARLSVAAGEPDPDTQNLIPAMGLKFLRDGVDSANTVAMYSVDGQDSFNFFANSWTTKIPVASLKLYPLALKFYTETYYIQQVGLSDMCSYDQAGNKIEDPVFPFYLRFEPTGAVEFPDDVYTDYREQLATIQAGTDLFRVYAWTAPEELGGEELYIGDIITDSEMTTSYFGDEHFFVRHQRAEDDIALKPEWTDYYPKFDPWHPTGPNMDESAFLANDDGSAWGCPFSGWFTQ